MEKQKGALELYLEEARRLKVADAQPEVLTFVATIDGLGRVTYQSPSIRITPGYMFACEEIRGGCPVPPSFLDDTIAARRAGTFQHGTIAEFLPFIGFNVLNGGQNRIIFKLPLAMNLFVNSLGSTEGLKFRTPISFFEGADISVTWFVDVLSLLRTWPLTGGNTKTQRVFDPSEDTDYGYSNSAHPERIRVEFYAYLVGSIIRSETTV